MSGVWKGYFPVNRDTNANGCTLVVTHISRLTLTVRLSYNSRSRLHDRTLLGLFRSLALTRAWSSVLSELVVRITR
jgi:hypothetical protein